MWELEIRSGLAGGTSTCQPISPAPIWIISIDYLQAQWLHSYQLTGPVEALFLSVFALLFLYLLKPPSVYILSPSMFNMLTVLALNAPAIGPSNICTVCGSVTILILGNKAVSLLFLVSQSEL